MNILARTSAALVGFLGPLATAQSTIVTPGVPPSARKVVVYDQGDFWPAAFVRHADDSVSALGNPWLGGRSRALLLPGVFDMARLDALTPGATEVVAMVGTSGLTLVRWIDAARGFELRAVTDPLAENARIVRAASFAPYHVIAVVPPGGLSVRCYRQSVNAAADLVCNLVSSFATTAPVLDAEVFRAASGAARLLLRTDTGVTCTDASGTVQWTAAGSGGKLARWPQSSAVRVAWVHTPAAATGWAVTRLGDAGPIDTYDVSWAFPANEPPVAAFAVDADHDGDVDVLVKTTSGVSLLHNQGVADFAQLAEVSFAQLATTSECAPDIVITHAGRRVRLVDEHGATGIGWSRVDVSPAGAWQGGTGFTGIVELVTTTTSGGQLQGGTTLAGNPTQLSFDLHVPWADLDPFVEAGTGTKMQVIAWHQAPSEGGSPDLQPECNLLVDMDGAELCEEDPSKWRFMIGLNQLQDLEDHLYWLTVRVCCISTTGSSLKLVSEPVTLVTSLSDSQQGTGWSYITSFDEPGNSDPLAGLVDGGWSGGMVIGVIQRKRIPPPPPPDLIPAPGTATGGGAAVRMSMSP